MSLARATTISLPPARELVLRSGESTQRAKGDLLQHVTAQAAHTLTLVDCRGDDYGASVLDELLTSSLIADLATGRLGQRFVALCGVSPGTYEELEFILARSGPTTGVVLVLETDVPPAVIGNLGGALREAWQWLLEVGQGTAPGLAEACSTSVPAANNRLNELGRLGLAYRSAEERVPTGGRRIVWEPVR